MSSAAAAAILIKPGPLAPFSWDPHKLGFTSQLTNTRVLELLQAVKIGTSAGEVSHYIQL